MIIDLAKEMCFDVKAPSNKSTRDKTFIGLLKTPVIIASGSSAKSFVVWS